MDEITSAKNPKIRQVCTLIEKSRERRALGLFVVEGKREIEHCIKGGFPIESLFFCEEIAPFNTISELLSPETQVFKVSHEAYSKIAYREGTEGVVAIVRERERKLEEVVLKEAPFVIVLESVEKPGNLGAVLRTADACGAAAVVVCDPLTDLYNPNLIRASIGGIFTLPVFTCSSEEAFGWLKSNDFQILTAQLQDSELYYDVDMKQPTAVVFGTESTGLSDFWRMRSDKKIRIPMLGELDSLNVSVSVAILSYEAVRQKR
ncbi:MAG: RNA methyltransferase [Bacteroidales bacterium]|nr:RNA methyltransferase [Bacteroidales bacterium]